MNKSIPWWRWLLVIVGGWLVWELAGIFSSLSALIVAGGDDTAIIGSFLPMIVFAVVRAAVVVIGIRYVWKLVKGDWTSIGFVIQNWKQDALYGAVAGVLFALLQFFILLPLTGGADRSDVIASTEIAGKNLASLLAAIILGWLAGALSEEVFFRGHLIRSLYKLMGNQPWNIALASGISIIFFALGHNYQGWIGVLNAGLLALFYTGLFLWRGRLTTSIVAHGIYDMLALLAIYFILLPAS